MSNVYCLYDDINKICRVGATRLNDDSRIKSQLGYYPFPLTFKKYPALYYYETETFIHRKFKDRRLGGEWFDIRPEEVDEVMQPILKRWERPMNGKHLSTFGMLVYKEPVKILPIIDNTLTDYEFFKTKMDKVLSEVIVPVVIITNHERTLAYRYAEELGHRVEVHQCDFENYKPAYVNRYKELLRIANGTVIFKHKGNDAIDKIERITKHYNLKRIIHYQTK